MKGLKRKLKKLQMLLEMNEDLLQIEVEFLNNTKKRLSKMEGNLQILVDERSKTNEIFQHGLINGNQMHNAFFYKSKLESTIEDCLREISVINIELKSRKEDVAKFIAKKTAITKIFDKNKRKIHSLESKAEQAASELITIRGFYNQNQK